MRRWTVQSPTSSRTKSVSVDLSAYQRRCTHVDGSDEILAKWPWFFEMKVLIAQRPNAVPVGLGNSQTEVDLSAILGRASEGAPDDDGKHKMADGPLDRGLTVR